MRRITWMMIIRRAIHRWPPVSSVISAMVHAVVKPSGTIMKSYTPSIVWIVTHAESICNRSRIIIRAIPWIIIITRSIKHGSSIYITSHITRRITHVNILWCCFVHIHIFYVVHWDRCRNFIYISRSCC